LTQAAVQTAIDALDKAAQIEIDNGAAPGLALAVVFQDKVLFAKGYGLRETGKADKVDGDTVFQLASVSKPLGATVVAKLVGEGKITWDTKIRDLDPGFQLYDPWVTREITIRDLYAHRSGLPQHVGDLLEDIGYDRAEVLQRLRYQVPKTSFRSHYAYTNFGMTKAGVAAADAYGLTWEQASADKLYKPLGMDSTSSTYKDFESRTNKAVSHVLVDGKWKHVEQRQPDAQSPAGGASSSVNDMAKWLRLQLANGKFDGIQIVNEAALLQTRQPQIVMGYSQSTGLPSFYGLGMNMSYEEQGRLRLSHSGAFALGGATAINIVPSEQVAVVILENGSPTGVVEGLAYNFMETVLYGKPSQDWLALFKPVFSDPAVVGTEVNADYTHPPVPPTPALKNDAYVGTYHNDYFGDIVIGTNADGLTISMGPKPITLPLTHYDRDTFTYETFGENASGASGVFFAIGADGKATTVRIEAFDRRENGVFPRKP